MMFADRSVFATLTAFDQFRLELDTPEERAAAIERRHFMTSAVITIATQPDPDVALLDMIVLVTLERIGAERLWLPTVFGEAGRPYLTVLLKLEETIWALGERVMTPPQIQELGAIVADWENNPPRVLPHGIVLRQSRVSAGRVRSAGAGVNRSRGLFASVRSAASSADDVKLQVERLIFLLQSMPTVVGAQAEYQLSKLGRAPEVAGTLEEVSGAMAALGRLAELADRIGPAAERLGVLLGDETTDLAEVLDSGDERLLGSRGLEQAAPGLEAAMQRVGGVGERLIDRAFVAGAKLIVIFLIGLLGTLLAYRSLAGRMPMTKTTQKGSAT